MSRVLVVEPNMTGHRPYYVRLVVEHALGLGNEVVIATRRGELESEDARPHLRCLSGRFQVAFADTWTIRTLAELSREIGADITVVPDGDRFAMKLALSNGWRGSGALSLLVMREVAQPHDLPGVQSAKTAARQMLFRRANGFRNVRVSVLKSAWWSGHSEMPIVRDPITLRTSAEAAGVLDREWHLTKDRYWFAVLGAISQRKNVDLVAAALRQVETRKIGFLVAGAWDPDMSIETREALDLLSAAGARVVVIDRVLAEEELDAAVQRTDCLVLAHSNEGPSGLLGKAAAAGTQIVAAGANSLRNDLTRLNGLGRWVGLTDSELASAFGHAMTQSRPAPIWPAEGTSFTEALLCLD